MFDIMLRNDVIYVIVFRNEVISSSCLGMGLCLGIMSCLSLCLWIRLCLLFCL